MKKFYFTLILLLFATSVYAQPPSAIFTLSFEHDGLNTDSYAVTVDGIRTTITPTCVGTGIARTCSSPLTLVLNIVHNVVVVAVGTFGESSSIPFVCDVPKAPVNMKVKK
jgi:hypothetical protein